MDVLRQNLKVLIADVPTHVICQRAGIANLKWLTRVMAQGITKPNKTTTANLTAIAKLFGLTHDDLFTPQQDELTRTKWELEKLKHYEKEVFSLHQQVAELKKQLEKSKQPNDQHNEAVIAKIRKLSFTGENELKKEVYNALSPAMMDLLNKTPKDQRGKVFARAIIEKLFGSYSFGIELALLIADSPVVNDYFETEQISDRNVIVREISGQLDNILSQFLPSKGLSTF